MNGRKIQRESRDKFPQQTCYTVECAAVFSVHYKRVRPHLTRLSRLPAALYSTGDIDTTATLVTPWLRLQLWLSWVGGARKADQIRDTRSLE